MIPRLLGLPWTRPFGVSARRLWDDAATAAAQATLSLVLLAYHAWDMVHAIVLTLVRLLFTQRRLLEWETAASTAARAAGLIGRGGLRTFEVEMASSSFIAIGALLAVRRVACRRMDVRGAVCRRVAVRAGHRLLAQPPCSSGALAV